MIFQVQYTHRYKCSIGITLHNIYKNYKNKTKERT